MHEVWNLDQFQYGRKVHVAKAIEASSSPQRLTFKIGVSAGFGA
jgi:hypothetical protein